MSRAISPSAAKAALHAGGEIAFLDVREAGPFSMGHPLFAIPCPWSRFELAVEALVPRSNVPVLLIDGGDGLADRAAAAMEELGYSDVAVIEGGTPGWEAAGFRLYQGVNVPSKTLGELAEHKLHPKTIDAATLRAWKDEGRTFRFFDCRPPAEYAKMRVPGAECLPNGELAHRFAAAVPDGGPVVITCAGRTRGIIGALGLSLAGIDGDIYALENGTQGWALAGEALERGNIPARYPDLADDDMEATSRRAEALIARERLSVIDAAIARELLADPGRTTFLFDVRSSEEAASDPLPGFTPALSGQLVQATDQWVGVRHARLVLADDLGLRAAIAAYWLRALGYAVHILPIDDAAFEIAAETPSVQPGNVHQCAAPEALAALRGGRGRLTDLRHSDRYRAGHVAGAIWSIRPELSKLAQDPARALYLIGDTEAEAALAAQDLRALGHNAVEIVAGGHDALRKAGAAVEASPLSPAIADSPDVTWFAHGRHDGDLDASRLYLTWEQGLIEQLDPQERADFRI